MVFHKSLIAIILVCLALSRATLRAQTITPKGSTDLISELTSDLTDKGRMADIDKSLTITNYSVFKCRKLLDQLYRIDQRYRDSVMNGSKLKQKQAFYWRKIKANNMANQALLNKIVDRYGWPTSKQFGEHGSYTAWLIVWHSERDYQRKFYPLIKHAYQQGSIKTSHLELSKRLSN